MRAQAEKSLSHSRRPVMLVVPKMYISPFLVSCIGTSTWNCHGSVGLPDRPISHWASSKSPNSSRRGGTKPLNTGPILRSGCCPFSRNLIHPTRISSCTIATSVPVGDRGLVLLLHVGARLAELDEGAAGADTVLGEIRSHWGAAVNSECRTLRCRYHHALLFPLLLDFTHSAFLCLAQVIALFRHARWWRGYLE